MEENYYKKYEPFFGSWYIKRKIGRGSFGTVFEITREEWGETFSSALKIITIPTSEDEAIQMMTSDGMTEEDVTTYYQGVVNEFSKECSLMSKLKGNTNIVSYEDHMIVPHEDGMGWDILIRMELLTPLLEYYKGEQIDEKKVLKLGIDICKALEICEKKNIIHRDIKPENIFVSNNGDFKLGDFGVARVLEGTTGASTAKGTKDYMAPEVISGVSSYTSNVDIYSLGIVMYKYLNKNRLPFYPLPPNTIGFREKQEAFSRRFKGDEFPNPVDAPEKLAEIIKKACAFQPEERFSSPESFHKALEAYIHGKDYIEERSTEKSDTIRTEIVKTKEDGTTNTIGERIGQERKNENEKQNDREDIDVLKLEQERLIKERNEQKQSEKLQQQIENNEVSIASCIVSFLLPVIGLILVIKNVLDDKKCVAETYAKCVVCGIGAYLILFVLSVYKEENTYTLDYPSYYESETSDASTSTSETNTSYSSDTSSMVDHDYEARTNLTDDYEVGDVVQFGEYNWIILDKTEEELLLFSQNVVDHRPYNDECVETTWEQCSLRRWLNEEFLKQAFNESDIELIEETNVLSSDNHGWGIDGGNSTRDKIFLLSDQELSDYAFTYETLIALDIKGESSWWWLRTPGADGILAASVLSDGDSFFYGKSVNDGDGGVRPALWVDLSRHSKK